jgi:hypothetical protein
VTTEENDDGFRRVYELLSDLVTEIDRIRKRHVSVLAGPELVTLTAIVGEEDNLDRDVHRLERQLRSHVA